MYLTFVKNILVKLNLRKSSKKKKKKKKCQRKGKSPFLLLSNNKIPLSCSELFLTIKK